VRDDGLPTAAETPASREFPPSFAQQRMWFLHQWDPESVFYHVPIAVRLRGRLDLDALRQALFEVVRRHETLRTTFPARNGVPVQSIAAATEPPPLRVTDLRRLPAPAREASLGEMTRQEVREAFDLAGGPVFRVSVYLLDAEEHLLLITMQHIVSDAWSAGILFGELALLYEAEVSGRPAEPPALPWQYRDYAAWQHEWLRGDVLDVKIDFWRRALEGVVPSPLPADLPRPGQLGSGGATHHFAMPDRTGSALRALALRWRRTPFVVLMAAYQALVYLRTRQDRFAIGFPIAGRTHPNTQQLIGLFVNTLALRADCSDEPTFHELVDRVSDAFMDVFEHQDLPFDIVVQRLQPPRDPGRHPIFQLVFALEAPLLGGRPGQARLAPGLSMEQFEVDTASAQFDLTLLVKDEGTGFTGRLVYSTELFTPESAARLAGQYQRLLASLAAEPDRPLSWHRLDGA
jgi:hypothetical protein